MISTDDVSDGSHDDDHFGLCTAWTNGGAKDPTNPAFSELQVAAVALGVSIDEYCATTIAAHLADEADDDVDGVNCGGGDQDDVEEDSSSIDDDQPEVDDDNCADDDHSADQHSDASDAATHHDNNGDNADNGDDASDDAHGKANGNGNNGNNG
jgi:hypothetical protein